jgi:hypothetical protein
MSAKKAGTPDETTPARRPSDPMGFMVAGMMELMKSQLGMTRCSELLEKYGLTEDLSKEPSLDDLDLGDEEA